MNVYNYVGIKLDEKPYVVRNIMDAQNLFGSKIGTIGEQEYVCDDSVVLRSPMSYTIVAEGNDTFVLKIAKLDMNSELP